MAALESTALTCSTNITITEELFKIFHECIVLSPIVVNFEYAVVSLSSSLCSTPYSSECLHENYEHNRSSRTQRTSHVNRSGISKQPEADDVSSISDACFTRYN